MYLLINSLKYILKILKIYSIVYFSNIIYYKLNKNTIFLLSLTKNHKLVSPNIYPK